jgi:hypothetical protein
LRRVAADDEASRTLMYLAAGIAALAMIAAVFGYFFSSSPLGMGRNSKTNLPSLYIADAEIKKQKQICAANRKRRCLLPVRTQHPPVLP